MTSCSTGLVTNSTPVRKRQIPLASSTEDHERSTVSHLKPKSWESTASAYIGLGATQKHHSQGWYPKHHGHMVATSQQKYSILSASTSHASLDGTAHEAHPTARTCATTTGECYHFLLRVVQSKPTSVPKMDRKWRGKRWLHQCFTILRSYCSMASLFPCGGHSRCRCLGSEFFFSLGNSEVRKIQVFVFESCTTLPSAEFFVAGIRVAFLVRSKALHGIAHGCMHQKIMPACSSVKVPNFPVFRKQRIFVSIELKLSHNSIFIYTIFIFFTKGKLLHSFICTLSE